LVFLLFGWPDSDWRGSCIAPAKWDLIVSFTVLFLGYRINSRTMMVTWPFYKREALYTEIQDVLKLKQGTMTPRPLASILGKNPICWRCCSLGDFISLLQPVQRPQSSLT
jgi:hypothetical protein